MKARVLMLIVMVSASLAIAASTQMPEDERRAAITVLRAINTAENAAKSSTGKYVPMAELLNHPMMGRVRPNIAVDGNTFRHAGAGIRLALSSDATQYVVTVVPASASGTAAFTDERGLIYTGKVLQ